MGMIGLGKICSRTVGNWMFDFDRLAALYFAPPVQSPSPTFAEAEGDGFVAAVDLFDVGDDALALGLRVEVVKPT